MDALFAPMYVSRLSPRVRIRLPQFGVRSSTSEESAIPQASAPPLSLSTTPILSAIHSFQLTMGSAQSYLSSEAALTALVVAGAIGLGYAQISQAPKSGPSAPAPSPSMAGKKGKKKQSAKQPEAPLLSGSAAALSGSAAAANPASTSQAENQASHVVPFPEVIPGQFDMASAELEPVVDAPASKTKKAKKKKGKTPTEPTAQAATPSADYQSESSVGPSKRKAKRVQSSMSTSKSTNLQQSTMSIDTDGSWTRVEPRHHQAAASAGEGQSAPSAELTTSDAGITTSVTGNSSPVAERTEDESFLSNARDSGDNRRTLAEKLLPKPRKTGVDDMLETSDHPAVARVMRVQPWPDEKPASGFSWGDYEDVRVADGGGNEADGEDDGWGVVKSKRSRPERSTPSNSQVQKAPESLTKRQRQNANKREEQKAAKAAGEAERLATLAKHKRSLERERMLEQYGGKEGGGKTPSGGMKATVDERGKLVWE